MSNDRFSRVRAFAGPNALEPRTGLMSGPVGPPGPTGPVLPGQAPFQNEIISGVANNVRVVRGSVGQNGNPVSLDGFTCTSPSNGE